MLRQLCGDDTLRNVVIVTNMWDHVQQEKGIAREEELQSDELLFRPVLEKGARMLRHDNTTASARAIVRQLAKGQPRTLRIQEELVEQKKDITQTAAGVELQGELSVLMKKHRKELEAVREEMTKALVERDLETRKELDETRRDLEKKLRTLESDRERLSREYLREKQEASEQIRKLLEAHERERQLRKEREAELVRLREVMQHEPKRNGVPDGLGEAGETSKKKIGVFSKIARLFKRR